MVEESNPVKGFSIIKTKNYRKACKKYSGIRKQVINTELNIVNFPFKITKLHGPLVKCPGKLHARVNDNMRILYEPNYKKKIITLTHLIIHDDMDKMCS